MFRAKIPYLNRAVQAIKPSPDALMSPIGHLRIALEFVERSRRFG